MTGRFKISNHEGAELKHRSSDFLGYNKNIRHTLPKMTSGSRMVEIEANRRWDIWLRPLAIFVSTILLIVVGVVIKSIAFDSFTSNNSDEVYERYQEMRKQEILDMLLSTGFVELERGNFGEAQREFQSYMTENPSDVQGALGMATTLVSRCELEERYCQRAIEYLDYVRGINNDHFNLLYEGSILALERRIRNLPYTAESL